MVPGARMRPTKLQVQRRTVFHKNQMQLGAAAASLQGKEKACSTMNVAQVKIVKFVNECQKEELGKILLRSSWF